MSLRCLVLTPRIVVRPMTEDDIPYIHELINVESVNRYMCNGKHPSIDDTMYWFQHLSADEAAWSILSRDNLAVLGNITLSPTEDKGVYEIGYALFPEWRGWGICTEAVKYVMNWCRSTTTITSIIGVIAKDNISSQHVAVRCGMHYVGDTTYEKSDGSKVFDSLIFERRLVLS